MKHVKHTQLIKPKGGVFHRNELAFIGAPCSLIQDLSQEIANQLNKTRIGYVDADHGVSDSKGPFHAVYTDKIEFHGLSFDHSAYEYRFRKTLNDCELVFVNGNHFKAEKQVVLIHTGKEDSLRRKLDRLTNVQALILTEKDSEVFFWLNEHFNGELPPVYELEDKNAITELVKCIVSTQVIPLKGLVFAGGQSTRMGQDKGSMDYHGKPQREYMADLLDPLCDETYLSVAPNSRLESKYEQIEDSFTGLGPYGGILSAFRSDPNSAWLTVACDIPFLDSETLRFLVENRDRSKMATCFHNPDTDFPEPLITIWEPRAYAELLHFLSIGYSCPRKALINSDICEVEVPSKEVLINVNTPEEYKEAITRMQAGIQDS